MKIGGLIFPGIDQADLTGPFEVLSRLPDAEFAVIGKQLQPVRDAKGLISPRRTILRRLPCPTFSSFRGDRE